MRFLDNVLQDFIERAPDRAWQRADYSAMRERSVGLGVMGFHSFLQSQNVPFESAMAKSWNMRIFKHMRRERRRGVSVMLAEERGACPDAAERGMMARFSPQARDRADRLDLDHLRRHQRRHRADPGQRLHPQDPVGLLRGEEPLSASACSTSKGTNTPDGLGIDPGARRLGAASRLPERRREGRLQDRLRDRPALDHRAGRRPHAATSARSSRSTSSCPATSTSGTCTCCTGRRGSAA